MSLRPVRYSAAWVLPVSAPPIRDGAVLVDARGRIAAVGPAAAVPTPDDAESLDLGEAALLPGLVNTHCHPELAAFRGLLDDLPFDDWIPTLLAAKRGSGLSQDEYVLAAKWTCAEALAAGMTTLGATEASAAAAEACREAGMRALVYRETFGPDPAQAEASLAELAAAVESLRERETDLVHIGVSPHAPYTVSDRLFRMVADYAIAESLPVAVHAAEGLVEDQLVREGVGRFAAGLNARGIATPRRAASTVALLEETRILRARPLVIHAVRVDAEDRRRLSDHGAAVAHCPIANARLGHGTAPLLEMLERGITVGLGTDSVASNNRLDLLEEARAAQLGQRVRHASGTILPADELLRLATIDGARALGVDGRVGTLEPGKDADLCAVSFAGSNVVPVHDPVSALFHAARGSDVVLAAVRGRVLFHRGQFLTLDVAEMRPRMDAAAAALRRARDEWRARLA
ncbi:MAG TPA: amidohydrolase family protein [Longimicrobiales bacterium]|nr:amidohydrolase family protein [Longimicrobiales bacterium]